MGRENGSMDRKRMGIGGELGRKLPRGKDQVGIRNLKCRISCSEARKVRKNGGKQEKMYKRRFDHEIEDAKKLREMAKEV